jgi:hypothetical protein
LRQCLVVGLGHHLLELRQIAEHGTQRFRRRSRWGFHQLAANGGFHLADIGIDLREPRGAASDTALRAGIREERRGIGEQLSHTVAGLLGTDLAAVRSAQHGLHFFKDLPQGDGALAAHRAALKVFLKHLLQVSSSSIQAPRSGAGGGTGGSRRCSIAEPTTSPSFWNRSV